jgi:phosphoribosylformylglycinamidine synthase
MSVKARITVYPRPEILDPQGKAIAGALERLGFDKIADVRAGKSFEIVLKKRRSKKLEAELGRMCEELLANPLVEDYTVELLEVESK